MPYKVVGGTRFYERKEVKDALAYLRVMLQPADAVNLRRILNTPKRGIGERAEACVAALADRERITFVGRRCSEPSRLPGLRPGRSRRSRLHPAAGGSAGRWSRAGPAWTGCWRRCSNSPAICAELRASPDPQDETRVENLAELVAVAQEFDEGGRAETGEPRSSPGRLP
jgi:DNA helicase-2/ATP-dependent DNA helicase PcrA